MSSKNSIKDSGRITVRQIIKQHHFSAQWIILIVALIIIGGLIGFNIFLEYERTIKSENDRLLTQTKVLQENIEQNLKATWDVLVSLRQYSPRGKANNELITRLQTLTDAIPGVRTLAIIDASGKIWASNRRELIGRNFRERDYFKIPAAAPDNEKLYISPPFKSVLGAFTLNAGIIIPGAKGDFAGVITAALDPAYFAPVLDSVIYAPDMWVGVAHWDGYLFMLRPERKEIEGSKFEESSFFFRHKKSAVKYTIHRGKANVTGDDRLLVVRTISPPGINMPNPLTVAASRNIKGVLTEWRSYSLKFIVLYILIGFASLVALFIFQIRQRQFRKEAIAAANALAQSEERFRSFVENANDIIYSLSPDGIFTYVSPNWKEILGHVVSEVIGHNFTTFVHPDDVPGCVSFLKKTLETGEKQGGVDYRVLHKNGSWRWHTSNAAIVRNQEDDAVTFIAIARDITERKRDEAEIKKYAQELERSNKELDDFAYIASHDLKEPLRGIHNYSSFLLEDYGDKLDDDGKDKLKTLVYLTQRLECFINDLLKFSRVSRVNLTIKTIEADKALSDAIDLLNPLLQKENVDIRINRPLPVVKGDYHQIVEVFQNLISNAVKYNDKNEKWIEIGYAQNKKISSHDIFYVRDNGIGIDEKYFNSIFTIFKRLHGRDKFGGGTGAGLTIVKKIIERHGGKIWLESKPTEGTTFYFTLEGEGNDR